LRFLAGLASFGDDTLLRGVAAELENEGIHIVASTVFLSSILTRAGVLTSRAPDAAQWRDIRAGVAVAKAIGAWTSGRAW